MIYIEQYSSTNHNAWNQFIKESKNGTFLLEREYMEYHSNRFTDHSLLIYQDSKLISILPANESEREFISHGGLTYGGLILSDTISAESTLACFDSIINYLKIQNFKTFFYKTIPHIYHKKPAEEDLYALFRNNASLIRRDISSSIPLFTDSAPNFSSRRIRGIRKANKHNLQCQESSDLEKFYEILSKNLETKHQVQPTHSLEELYLLKNLFPENIKLFTSENENGLLAGVIIYETETVAHAQYISNTETGKDLGALDILFSYLIKEVYKNKRYFDFGISTTKQGLELNAGLIQQKEEFGARGIVYDTYLIKI